LTVVQYFSRKFLFLFSQKSEHFITHYQNEITNKFPSYFDSGPNLNQKGGEIDNINNLKLIESTIRKEGGKTIYKAKTMWLVM